MSDIIRYVLSKNQSTYGKIHKKFYSMNMFKTKRLGLNKIFFFWLNGTAPCKGKYFWYWIYLMNSFCVIFGLCVTLKYSGKKSNFSLWLINNMIIPIFQLYTYVVTMEKRIRSDISESAIAYMLRVHKFDFSLCY